MSEDKVTLDQYGRRSWNVEAYQRDATTKIKQTPQNEHARIDAQSSQTYLDHRDELLKKSLSAVKTYNIINPLNSGSSSFGNNKRFGFFCPVCNLSFRDNLALIDHLNSPQHIGRVRELGSKEDQEGEELEGGVYRASLQEVVNTIEVLVAKSVKAKNQSSDATLSFSERVERRKQFEEKKRQKRKSKKEKVGARKKQAITEDDEQVSSMMGFSGFGSTKVK